MSILAVTTVVFPTSGFVPIAVGFFGLGVGYLIYGAQELFALPQRSRSVDLTTGIWGIWMPKRDGTGFCSDEGIRARERERGAVGCTPERTAAA
jgi:hypothetical protein